MANKLDSLDYKILKMLSLNARKPYLEIARACNVSGAAIHQRIQKLYNMGVIKGSISLIDPASVGYQIPSLQGPCDRSLKSEVPCGSCLNWR